MTAQHTPGPWLTLQHCAIVPLPANTYTRIYAHRPGQEDITIGYKVLGQSEDRLLQHASHRVECPTVRPGDKLRLVGRVERLGEAHQTEIGIHSPISGSSQGT
jgi:hypothetical protein